MEKSCDNCKYERSRTESVQPYEEPCISCNGNTNWVEYEEEYRIYITQKQAYHLYNLINLAMDQISEANSKHKRNEIELSNDLLDEMHEAAYQGCSFQLKIVHIVSEYFDKLDEKEKKQWT